MVRQTIRRLRRSPGLTLTALLTLAIGTGAAAAMFSVVNGVLLQPLPYPESDRLVALTHQFRSATGLPASTAIYFTYRDNNRALQSVALWTAGTASVTGLGRPEEVRLLRTTFDFLPTLRVVPARGRAFTAAEDQPGGPRAVILTHGYWQRRFGGTAVVGSNLTIDAQPYTVVGILPDTFRFPEAADLMLPMQPNRAVSYAGPLGENAIARLRDGVTLDAANADVDRMVPIVAKTFPPVPGMDARAFTSLEFRGDVQSLKSLVVGDLVTVLWVLMGTVGLLFVVACVNVANLQLVRTDARAHELAVEASLGASTGHIVRGLLLESTLLGLAGGGIGLLLAAAGLPALLTFASNQIPLSVDVAISGNVMAFTVAISLGGGVLFGAIPALRYLRRPPASANTWSRSHTKGRGTHLVQSQLLAAQVALALVLLVAGGLMLRTFQSLRAVDPGFTDPDRLQTLTVSLPRTIAPTFADARQRLQALQERLAAAPGVSAVGFATRVPLGATGPSTPFFVETAPSSSAQARRPQEFRFVSPGFFQTMGIRLVAGRAFDWTDQGGERRVAIVSESMARTAWGNAETAVGKRIRMTAAEPWAEVVGVVGDVHHESLVEAPEQAVYLTLGERMAEFMGRTVTFVVRSDRVGTSGFLEGLQDAVWSVAPELPLAQTRSMGSIWRSAMDRTTLTLILIGITGTMAALLGLIGIYGVTSYVVAQRFREIGIRMALGAQAMALWRTLLGRVALLTMVGVALGVGTALALSRQMAPLLYGVTAVDPATYSVMSGILLATALMAGAVAARRVTSGAPLRALRTDG